MTSSCSSSRRPVDDGKLSERSATSTAVLPPSTVARVGRNLRPQRRPDRTRFDAVRGQLGPDQRAGRNVDATHRRQPVRRLGPRLLARTVDTFQRCEGPRVTIGDAPLGGDEFGETPELGDPERGGEVGQSVVVADLVVGVVAARAGAPASTGDGPRARAPRRR